MNNKKDEVIEKISNIKSISSKQARKVLIDLINIKKYNENYMFSLSEDISNLNYCIKCNKITDSIDKICHTCKENKSATLIVIKNQLEYFNLEKILELNEYNSYILNISTRNDLIKFLSFKEEFLDFKNYVSDNINIKEIIFSFSHTSENDVLATFIEENLDKSLKFFQLAKGLPSGNSVEYMDQETLKYAFKNKEKI